MGDYPLAMNNTSYITTNNGNVAVNGQVAASNSYAGYFVNSVPSTDGIYASGPSTGITAPAAITPSDDAVRITCKRLNVLSRVIFLKVKNAV
jgi:hypothetical protein